MHTLTVPVRADLTHYQAGAIVFQCFDDRFFHLFERLMEALEKEDAEEAGVDQAVVYIDRVITAGGAKDLVADGTPEQVSLMGQIAKSVKLHHTHNIIAITHEDCGAYGDEATQGGDREKQFLYHVARHREIEAAILAKYPEFAGKIRHFYLSINGAIELDIAKEELTEEEARGLSLFA
ncbi:hypothetical protein A2851_00760 [Candidatus Kaiserbacteria bacterium RIFCSPHIGHO2_01_FULL_53_29]|uniref:Carbonic anhydrase n=1 Tax=Candidatus Kaiserbacteria bacterium RIFCSPHIGHO2_01_FULL_53_29 TaxID=1798480 RepID=A0A1F6CYD7_9BACT|nr:MAG: hypothetical protein A2851_00760 [Candidatus Kaiserbacteria bacterium RIFCSPHIGHO2_01_FULL_53_29]